MSKKIVKYYLLLKMKLSSALLIASATATTLVANDFAEEEQNFVKLAEGMTEVAEEKT